MSTTDTQDYINLSSLSTAISTPHKQRCCW